MTDDTIPAQALIGGRFRVEREIARGGMGAVLLAADMRSGTRVALKRMLSPGIARDRFTREASVLARMTHERIVRYVDHGEDHVGPWLAMEWLEGMDLTSTLWPHSPLAAMFNACSRWNPADVRC